MRKLPIDRCPSCGIRAIHNTYCAHCDVDMVDANGRASLEPTVFERRRTWKLPSLAILVVGLGVSRFVLVLLSVYFPHFVALAVGLGVQGLVVLAAIQAIKLASRMASRASRKRSVRSVAEARGPRAAIRGRVVTLRPAAGAPTHREAVLVKRETRQTFGRTWANYALGDGLYDFASWVENQTCDVSVGGRFAVVDETGVAIVDDDALVVVDERLDRGARPIDSLCDGDVVDVFGPASRGEAMDAIRAGASAAHAKNALVFDGGPQEKVWIVVRSAGARPAPDRIAREQLVFAPVSAEAA